ncbi:MAG: helix-turn-helix transcriptional regulator [Chitinophagales bacterium]
MAYENDRNKQQRKKMHYSPNLLGCLNNAIDNNRMATLEYESRENEVSQRDIEPMALIYKNRKRHLVAYCLLRNDYRTFRLDRINLFKINKAEFTPKEGFDAAKFEIDDEYPNSNESSSNETK